MTYGHLQADCLYTGISSGPNARYRVWEAFTFFVLVADRSEAGRRPVADLLARYMRRDRPNYSSLQVCDQDSVTEFGFEPVCDQDRAGSSYLDMPR